MGYTARATPPMVHLAMAPRLGGSGDKTHQSWFFKDLDVLV